MLLLKRRGGRFFGDFEAITYLELVKPALARDKITTGRKLDRLILNHSCSYGLLATSLTKIPIVEILFHGWVLGFAPSTFLALAADFHPAFERLQRHFVNTSSLPRALILSLLSKKQNNVS